MFESYLRLSLSWDLVQVPPFLGATVSLSICVLEIVTEVILCIVVSMLYKSGLFVAQSPASQEVLHEGGPQHIHVFVEQMNGWAPTGCQALCWALQRCC